MRIIPFATLLALLTLGGCRKDEPTPTPTPNPQPQPEIPTVADIEAYYALDRTVDIATAQAKITATTEEKTINAKKIQIKETEIKDSKPTEGSFTLVVKTGSIQGKTFTGSYALSGFKKVTRPDDATIARRMVASWRVAPEVYLKGIELDALYLDGKADWFTAEALAPYVRFSSSDVAGTPYELTSEEAKELQLREVKYTASETTGQGELTFKTVYKGVASSDPIRLALSSNEYYAQRVQVDADFAPRHYMRGVYEYLDIYFGSMIKFDNQRYVALLKPGSKHENNSANSLSFSIELRRPGAGAERTIATIPLEVSGFKPLTKLAEELYISHDVSFLQDMNDRLKRWNNQGDLATYLNNGLENWIVKTQWLFKHPSNPQNLSWSQKQSSGGSQLLLSGSSSHDEARDLYLLAPKLRVKEATLSGKNLQITLELLSVNEVALENVTFPFPVQGLSI